MHFFARFVIMKKMMIIMVRDGMGLNFISITNSISRLWLVGPVSEKMDVAISNLFSLFEVYY